MERFQSRRCRKICPGLARSGDESLEVTLERHEQCVSARAEVLAERFRRCTFCKRCQYGRPAVGIYEEG